MTTHVSWYQNVSILDFTGAKDDGRDGDNWRYKTCKAPVKSSPSTNQQPAFYRLYGLRVAQPTVQSTEVKKYNKQQYLTTQMLPVGTEQTKLVNVPKLSGH